MSPLMIGVFGLVALCSVLPDTSVDPALCVCDRRCESAEADNGYRSPGSIRMSRPGHPCAGGSCVNDAGGATQDNNAVDDVDDGDAAGEPDCVSVLLADEDGDMDGERKGYPGRGKRSSGYAPRGSRYNSGYGGYSGRGGYYGPGYGNGNGNGGGEQGEVSSVATCSALQGVSERVTNLTIEINNSQTLQNDELTLIAERVQVLEDDVNGEKNLIRVFLSLAGDRKRVCSFNTLLEVADICRRLNFRIPDPYFMHLDCNDPAIAKQGDRCYNSDDYWMIKPLCFNSASQIGGLLSCVEPAPAGVGCRRLSYISCQGYAVGNLNRDAAMSTVDETMSDVDDNEMV